MASDKEQKGLPAEKRSKPTWSEENLTRAESFAHKDTDVYGFAYEQGDEFSDLPLSFEEYMEGLAEDLEDIYGLTTIDNRFSPNYLSSCSLMEKLINRLGSCCVTRAVLEKKGVTFTKAERISVGFLYRCVSFNYRKCRAALKEGKEKHILDFKLLDLECRLFSLAERLNSTAEKIQQIRDGRISADSMLKQAEVMRTLSGACSKSGKAEMLSAHRRAGSLPVLGSMARKIVQKEKPVKEKPIKWPSIPGVFEAKPFPKLKKDALEESLIKLRADLAKKKGKQERPAASAEKAEPEGPGQDLTAETEQIQMEVWKRFRDSMFGENAEDNSPVKTEHKGPLPKHKKKKR